MGCGFVLIKAGDHRTDQGAQTPSVPTPDRSEDEGVQTPSVPVSRPTHHQPAIPLPASDQQRLQVDFTALQRAFQEEKEQNAKRHADLLALLTALQPKPQHLEITHPLLCFTYAPYHFCF